VRGQLITFQFGGFEAASPIGCRRHWGPRDAECRRPSSPDFSEDGVRRPGRLVAPKNLSEVVMLVLDHAHPYSKDSLAHTGKRVHATGLAGGRVLRSCFDEPIGLQLSQRPVHGRTVDVTKLEFFEAGHQPVAVPRLL
jgi:hypothetical protein